MADETSKKVQDRWTRLPFKYSAQCGRQRVAEIPVFVNHHAFVVRYFFTHGRLSETEIPSVYITIPFENMHQPAVQSVSFSLSLSDKARHAKVQDYKDSLKTKAENLILKGFPETIVNLNEILETPAFNNRHFSDVYYELNIPVPDPILLNKNDDDLPPAKKTKYDNSISQDGTKVMMLPSGPVPSNKHLLELVEIVKPHIRKLMEDSNLLKMWISFMIPKIEDGNNFGVSIQEDTLAEVQSVESEAAAFFDQISRYFISRGKLVSKVAKYPHLDDYRRAVQELDEKEYLSLWLMMAEIRNRYCSLHDIVIKNIDKIKKPRSSNAAESLY